MLRSEFLKKSLFAFVTIAIAPEIAVSSEPIKTVPFIPSQAFEGWCRDDFSIHLMAQYNSLAQHWLTTEKC